MTTGARQEFERDILQLLKEESLQDGYAHPAEVLLAATLREHRHGALWMHNLFLAHQTNPGIATGLLQCLGRVRCDRLEPWGKIMARAGLASASIATREAAVTAFEAWGDRESLALLQGHTESVPWLARYIKQVIKDVSDAPAQPGGHSMEQAVVPLHEHESIVIETQYGMRVRILHTAVGELEIERLDGGTLTVVPLTRTVILVLPVIVSPRQRDAMSKTEENDA